jgi:endogenous inhibitor of DNA gyrase (YacG/DUF329 family)
MAMDDNVQIGFQRCYTCGKWHPAAGAHSERFCSRKCAQSFQRCPVCGEYFNVDLLNMDGFCSAECAGVDAKDRPEKITEVTAKPDE